jgi:hypothetical protein
MFERLKRTSFISLACILTIVSIFFGLIILVILQNQTINTLKQHCDIETLKPLRNNRNDKHHFTSSTSTSLNTIIDNKANTTIIMKSNSSSNEYKKEEVQGSAFTIFLGSPKWFQNRYSMMINMLLGSLPKGWIIQIFYLPNNKMSKEAVNHPGILKQIEKGNVELVPIPTQYAKLKKRDLMVLPWLWEQLRADKVLTFGGTNVLCSNSPLNLDSDFGNFDYIGSPANQLHGMGGDGGLSLRNRTVMLDILNRSEQKKIEKKIGEDVFFVKNMLKLRKSGIASYDIGDVKDTKAFALNDGTQNFDIDFNPEFINSVDYGSLPLGAQGTLSGLNDVQRGKALDFCPELKMFFPSLHSTSCFGASPRPLECFKFLCEYGGLRCDEDAMIEGGMEFRINVKKSDNKLKGKLKIEMIE